MPNRSPKRPSAAGTVCAAASVPTPLKAALQSP
jgi:hypothetical protein